MNKRLFRLFSALALASETTAGYISAGADVLTGTAQMLVVPLVGRLGLLNLLTLAHEKENYFNPDRLLLLQVIASQVTAPLCQPAFNPPLDSFCSQGVCLLS